MQGTKVFHHWEVVEGEGLVIDNPNAVSTSFTMIDGTVTIEAKYLDTYLINVLDGAAPLMPLRVKW